MELILQYRIVSYIFWLYFSALRKEHTITIRNAQPVDAEKPESRSSSMPDRQRRKRNKSSEDGGGGDGGIDDAASNDKQDKSVVVFKELVSCKLLPHGRQMCNQTRDERRDTCECNDTEEPHVTLVVAEFPYLVST